MIRFSQKGDYHKIRNYLFDSTRPLNTKKIHQYCQEAVSELKKNTPTDSGDTAFSWRYEININKNSIEILFINDNIQNGVNVAILLEYGHATINGGWVEGNDYIGKSINPYLKKIEDEIKKEVT